MAQDPTTTKSDNAPPRRRLARWLFWLRAVFVVSLLPLAFAAAAAVMMIDREITAPSWIERQIEARANELAGDAKLSFGAITVRVGRDLHPRVRLVDTQLVNADGSTITRVPVVEGLMSPRGLILQQAVLMQEVRLIGAQVNLRRAANGDLSFAFSGTGADLGQARSLPFLLEQFDQLFEQPALEALEVVEAQGLVVNFDDARAGRSWIVDGGTATLDLRDDQTEIRGDFSLLAGRPVATRVQLSYSSPRGSRAAQIGLNLTDAMAADLAEQSASLRWLAGIDAPLTAALRTGLDATGALGPLNARLDLGQGAFQPNAATAPVKFDDAQAYFTFDPVRDLVSFSEMSVRTEWGQFAASGDAYLRDFRDGLPGSVLAQLQFRDLAVDPPGFYETAPQIAQLSLDFRMRFAPFSVEIGQVMAQAGDSRLLADGTIRATDAGWDVALDAKVDQITPEAMLGFWPAPMKPRSRDWVSKNFRGGLLRDTVVGLRRAPLRAPELGVSFAFDGSEVKFLRNIAPITGVVGVASIADSQMVISLDAGTVLAPQGGLIDVAGTDFTIFDLRMKPSPAILNLRTDGTVTAALSVLNQPPFSYMDKAGLPVTLADGRAMAQGRITWSLVPRPAAEDVVVDMTADLQRVRSDTLIPGRRFIAPNLQVKASRAGINIAGPVQVGAVRAVGAWEQRFGDPARPGSQMLAEVDLGQAFLDEFNIALPRGTVSGQGTGELAISFQKDTPPAFSLTSDLVGMRVALPAVGWAKGPSTPGELSITGSLGAVPQIDGLVVRGGGLQAVGRIDLNASGGLQAARFSQVRVGDWLNAPITLRGRGPGQAVGVEIGGGVLDLRGARFGGSQGDGGPITIALDRLQVTEGIAFNEFRGEFRSDGGFRGDFRARVNGRARLQGTVAPRNGRSAVRLRSDNAGGVLRSAGLIENARGGSLDLTLLPTTAAGTFDGRLDMRDLRVRDAPAIAALLDAISVIGLLQQLDGQGLAFDQVEARFRLTPSQIIVSEASAVGPGLGISVDGTYTLASKVIDLQGVVSPFFLVNSIGSFLTRKGEGLIGFNYNVRGTTDAPQVSVNPLSVLTPGMFREIFRRPAPELSQ
ncbi:MAG: DUF3971 domain-containing protein [Yoonia sp.]|uniref:DUF3971 domain-containing protein n=1 Tax=Yoonia sp. TaxID=2212373 RepID=UPI003EF5F6BB